MGGFGGGGMDPNDIFQMFMGGGMGGQGRGRGGARADPFGDMGGFNFGNMGGGRGGNQQFTFRFQ